VSVTVRKRWPRSDPSPQDNRQPAWWAPMKEPAFRERFSPTRGRAANGLEWVDSLLIDEPAFAAAVAALEPTFIEHVGFSLQHALASGEPVSGDTRVQAVLMGLQLALTELWRSHGVEPDAVIGVSMGEVTAAVVAGALTTAEGLRVITARSRQMSQSTETELASALGDLAPKRPRIPFISTVVDPAEPPPPLDADYWVANARTPPRLGEAVTAAGIEHTTFIAIGPDPVLTQTITDALPSDSHHHSIGTLERDGDDTISFHTSLNRTHTADPPPTPHPSEPHVALPTTPWHHTRHWLPAPKATGVGVGWCWCFRGRVRSGWGWVRGCMGSLRFLLSSWIPVVRRWAGLWIGRWLMWCGGGGGAGAGSGGCGAAGVVGGDGVVGAVVAVGGGGC